MDSLVESKPAPSATSLSPRLLAETARLWSIIRERYTGRNGLLNYFVDPFAGRALRTTDAIKDFGDSLQYAAYAAALLNDPTLTEWALSQITIAARLFQQRAGFFLTDGTTDVMTPPRASGYFKLEDNSDLLMGLVGVYRITRRPEVLAIIEPLVGFLERLTARNAASPNLFWLAGHRRVPLPFRLPDGLFIEELVHLSELTGEKRFLQLAERMSASWEKSAYARRHAFYPIAALAGGESGWREWVMLDSQALEWAAPRLAKRFRSSHFIKLNTNMISGELALYRVTGSPRVRERLVRWLAQAQRILQRPDGYFYGHWDPRAGPSHGGYPLADNHHLINVFEDAAWILKDPAYLAVAEKNAEFWMAHVTPLGLFPELYKPQYERAAILDNQVDYLITLIKLYELTGKTAYLDRVIGSMEGLLVHFHAEFGLKWCINADTGENLKPAICTKFLSLFTKLTLVLHDVLSGQKLLQNYALFDLSRDR